MKKTKHTFAANIKEPKAETESGILDKVILLLISGLSQEAILLTCQTKFELKPKTALSIINNAKKKIFLAAHYNPLEQVGLAVTRLNDLYKQSVRVQDVKTALAAQKELNKLMDLYTVERTPPDGGQHQAVEGTEKAREHLLSLNLGKPEDSIEELARRAVAEIVKLANDK